MAAYGFRTSHPSWASGNLLGAPHKPGTMMAFAGLVVGGAPSRKCRPTSLADAGNGERFAGLQGRGVANSNKEEHMRTLRVRKTSGNILLEQLESRTLLTASFNVSNQVFALQAGSPQD